MKTLINSLILAVFLLSVLISCDDEPEIEYVTEEQLIEEGVLEYADEEIPQPGDEDYVPPAYDPDTVKDNQDDEPTITTVEELRSNLLTDGKLDSDKVLETIIHTFKYMSTYEQSAAFVCGDLAYLATPILLPMKKNESFTYIYLPRKFGKKSYHFILLNFKGIISGKSYSVECQKELMNYKELFVFLPENENKNQRTQTGILLAIADEYLKDVDNMININWQVGEEDATFKDFGTVQVYLKKDVSQYLNRSKDNS